MTTLRSLLLLVLVALAALTADEGVITARGRRAVRIGAMSPRQARTLLSEHTAGVDAFMRRPYRTTNQQRDYAALGAIRRRSIGRSRPAPRG